MESVEGGTRDEGGLVFDPELADRVEAVGENNALDRSKKVGGSGTGTAIDGISDRILRTLLPMRTWNTGPNDLAHFRATTAC